MSMDNELKFEIYEHILESLLKTKPLAEKNQILMAGFTEVVTKKYERLKYPTLKVQITHQ